MFNNSSRLTITGSTLSSVNGSQYNTYNNYHFDLKARSRFPEEEWKAELHREYDRIRTGRIKLLRTVCESPVSRCQYEETTRLTMIEAWDDSRATRVFGLALLNTGQEMSLFSSVAYTGPDAEKVFKKDCIDFSRIKRANFVQLHAFNDSENLMIFFHDELIPLAHVFHKHPHCRATLSRYISFQDELIPSESVPDDFQYLRNMWIRLRDGALVYGPKGPRSTFCSFMVEDNVTVTAQTLRHDVPSPLQVNSYKDQYLLSYLADMFLRGFYLPNDPLFCDRPVTVYPSLLSYTHLAVLSATSSLPRIIARFPELGGESLWNLQVSFPDSYEDHYVQTFMRDGRIRFEINRRLEYFDQICFKFTLDQSYTEKMSCVWLAQACHIFSRLNIPCNCWKNYGFLHEVTFELNPYGCPTQWTAPVYTRSFDPNGCTMMTEKERLMQGLRHFTPNVTTEMKVWTTKDYDFMRALQEVKGVDPTTTEFANLAGLPILEIVSTEVNHFEDVFDDTDSLLSTLDNENEEDDMDVDSHCIQSSREGVVREMGMDIEMGDSSSPSVENLTGNVLMDVDD
ncbi:hypothetical protein L218DRAFT_992205 [Marasmius fiardii PR-910]|nr:hypothetical protein L218DRAFT_992205 [Marasmius fiardii PR-910]